MSVDLSALPVGRSGRIVDLDTEVGLALRMGELGLRSGTVVSVVHHGGATGRVVSIGGDRFALDLAACRAVRLVPIT
jgi:Fe2+ transport system protein FeoA